MQTFINVLFLVFIVMNFILAFLPNKDLQTGRFTVEGKKTKYEKVFATVLVVIWIILEFTA